jgi:hypothetical protein
VDIEIEVKKDKSAPCPAVPRDNQGESRLSSRLSRYTTVALGVPISILVLGIGAGWVAIGFKADTTPRT